MQFGTIEFGTSEFSSGGAQPPGASLSFPDEIYLRRRISDFGTPQNAAILQTDHFTGDGLTNFLTLTLNPDTTFPIYLYQNEGTDPSGPWVLQPSGYTYTNGTITFFTPPLPGSTWKVAYNVQF